MAFAGMHGDVHGGDARRFQMGDEFFLLLGVEAIIAVDAEDEVVVPSGFGFGEERGVAIHSGIAQWVEAQGLREDVAAELRDHRHAGLRVVDAHEVDVLGEVQFRRILDRRGRGGVGVQDAVGDRDDAATGALAEDRVETRDRGCAGIDEVTEHIAGADGRELVDVADEQHVGRAGHRAQHAADGEDYRPV